MKKVLSILLALTLAVTSMATVTAAYAESDNQTTVQYSVYDGGMFTMQPQNIKVSADLSDKYASKTGFNDTKSEPTILDATIAAHIAMFGEDFSDYAPFSCTSSGWITKAFGETTSATSYRQNGFSAYSLDTQISNNDYIEFMFYQDTYGYSDKYTAFDSRSKAINVNESITLTATCEGYDASWNMVTLPASGLKITVDGEVAGTADENGCITLSFDKAGTYIISSESFIDSTPVFAPYCEVTVKNPLLEYVNAQKINAAKYLLNGISKLDTTAAVDYLTYLKSGYDMSAYNNAFINSVKANLKANNGKLLSAYNSEDIGLYGSVIQSLEILGYDPHNFNGFNIVNSFEKIDLNVDYHPYYYRVAIEAADKDFALKLCDSLINSRYTLGKGMNYYGFSCDNTAHFVTAIAKYKDNYKNIVNDALSVIKSYTTSDGAYYSNDYKDVNSDSTALAMMAYSAVENTDEAFKLYKNLTESFESKTGIFTYIGEDSAYSTKDVLLSLEYFAQAVENNNYSHPQHVEKLIKTVKSTCTKKGNKTYRCVICKSTRTQALALAAHSYKTAVTKKATPTSNGKAVTKCSICSKVKSTKAIYKASKISLSKTSYTYDAKVKKPTVTVKDSKGNKIDKKYYTVSYAKGRKNVGKYAVKITFKGNYSGSKTLYFTIKPKTTSITKLTAESKGFSAKWKTQKTQTTGYQIQYSTSSKFAAKSTNTLSVIKNSTSSVRKAKLKAKKKYYVRIRTYKSVKVNGKSTRIYSSWSKAKSVTTKK